MQEILTLREAAAFLRCHPDTVKRRARAGELPASKIGRAWRFRRAELDAWLARGGTLQEAVVDRGVALAIEDAKAEVAAGRSRVVSWEEAEAALDS